MPNRDTIGWHPLWQLDCHLPRCYQAVSLSGSKQCLYLGVVRELCSSDFKIPKPSIVTCWVCWVVDLGLGDLLVRIRSTCPEMAQFLYLPLL